MQREAEMRDCVAPELMEKTAELVLDVLPFAGFSLWEVKLLYCFFLGSLCSLNLSFCLSKSVCVCVCVRAQANSSTPFNQGENHQRMSDTTILAIG